MLAAALALVPAASANGEPRLRAYDYALAFVGDDEEGDYIWRYGYTMCTSHAARVKERFLIDAGGALLFTVFYLDRKKAGCKRYRSYFDQNEREVRVRVRLWWRGLRVIAPWREATCEPRCP